MGEIVASVLELKHDGSPGGLGEHKFLSVPSPGDVVRTFHPSGNLEFWKVEYVEHHPVEVPTPQLARQDPHVVVVVSFLREWRPPD